MGRGRRRRGRGNNSGGNSNRGGRGRRGRGRQRGRGGNRQRNRRGERGRQADNARDEEGAIHWDGKSGGWRVWKEAFIRRLYAGKETRLAAALAEGLIDIPLEHKTKPQQAATAQPAVPSTPTAAPTLMGAALAAARAATPPPTPPPAPHVHELSAADRQRLIDLDARLHTDMPINMSAHRHVQ